MTSDEFVWQPADGRPTYCDNPFGLRRTHIRGDQPVPSGDHQARLEFTYDSGGLGKGATAEIYLGWTQVATGRIDATTPLAFSRGRDPRRRLRHRHPGQ